MKLENVELDETNTEEIDRVTRQLIHHIREAKNKAITQTKYKTLPHPEDTVKMASIRDKINQQIEVIGCNTWQFQEPKQLAQEERDAKWTEIGLCCETDRSVPSLFWQQVRRLRDNKQKKDRGTKDENNRIRLDPKRKKEALRTQAGNIKNSTRRHHRI